jgi:hypothetical protein
MPLPTDAKCCSAVSRKQLLTGPRQVVKTTLLSSRNRQEIRFWSVQVQSRQPIGIFEIPERGLPTMLSLVLTTVFVILAAPFMRPFQWTRLLWTYVIPLIPLVCLWDGEVSQLRACSVWEMSNLTRGLEDFDWTAARVGIARSPGHLTYLLGIPRHSDIFML